MSWRGSLYLIAAATFLVTTSVSAETPNQKAVPQVNAPIRKLGQGPRIRAMGTAMPLTNKECSDLGGMIDASSKSCTDGGMFTCATVDSRGTTRRVCIDNK
jgi:hypothetical protein